jgi:hypothetical protein
VTNTVQAPSLVEKAEPVQAPSLVEKAEPVQVQVARYAWEPTELCECKMDVKSTWIPTWHQMDYVP